MNPSIQILGATTPAHADLFTPAALDFLVGLQREFNSTRQALLRRRADRQSEIDAGAAPDFLPETETIRQAEWQIDPLPADLQDRRVEITGPVERKMMINGLNSGARVFMADIEDSLAPTWDNVLQGQINLRAAVRRGLQFTSAEGKAYRLNDKIATLVVRPRGWHLLEKHMLVDCQPISASLFDFGLYFFHNATELLERGSGPYFYLPKLENHLEARLWNNVFKYAQDALNLKRGTIKATVLIETILAVFEMEEILYELRNHSAGFNAGRWDYIFSVIKKFRNRQDYTLPDRAQITMTVPFMRAYTELIVRTCHRRGAHAIGGMAAHIPSRKDAEINERAITKVLEDKEREASDGFDGTWVAHPDLVPIAMAAFDRVLRQSPHQKHRLRDDVSVSARELANFHVPGGRVTEDGIRNNISVALQYLEAWLRGTGAVAIFNLMEDVATAEIARAQLWQWLRLRSEFTKSSSPVGGARGNAELGVVTEALYKQIRAQELEKLVAQEGNQYSDAVEILDNLVFNDQFIEFLTLPAYNYSN
jgi:malate synthase